MHCTNLSRWVGGCGRDGKSACCTPVSRPRLGSSTFSPAAAVSCPRTAHSNTMQARSACVALLATCLLMAAGASACGFARGCVRPHWSRCGLSGSARAAARARDLALWPGRPALTCWRPPPPTPHPMAVQRRPGRGPAGQPPCSAAGGCRRQLCEQRGVGRVHAAEADAGAWGVRRPRHTDRVSTTTCWRVHGRSLPEALCSRPGGMALVGWGCSHPTLCLTPPRYKHRPSQVGRPAKP